ncbi:hypothetical protein KCP77_22680 [Salmonella enterica subsp. enterica]|nr:hypothetical protein KCP77_22680 [Salmonella enterica subsp. enterica]
MSFCSLKPCLSPERDGAPAVMNIGRCGDLRSDGRYASKPARWLRAILDLMRSSIVEWDAA